MDRPYQQWRIIRRSAERGGKLYDEASTKSDGHINAIILAQDKKAELESMVEELNFLYQSVERQIVSATSPSAPSASAQATPNAVAQGPTMKLPKQELPVFNGDPTTWNAFYELFNASVHSQPIPDIQKMGYLRTSQIVWGRQNGCIWFLSFS